MKHVKEMLKTGNTVLLETYNGRTDRLVPSLKDVDGVVEEGTGLMIRIVERPFERSILLTWILADEMIQEVCFINNVPTNHGCFSLTQSLKDVFIEWHLLLQPEIDNLKIDLLRLANIQTVDMGLVTQRGILVAVLNVQVHKNACVREYVERPRLLSAEETLNSVVYCTKLAWLRPK